MVRGEGGSGYHWRVPIEPHHSQFEAWTGKHIPEMSQVSEGVWAVPLPIEFDSYVRHTFTYLILDDRGGVHVVDPGVFLEDNKFRLDSAFGQIGKRFEDIRSIVSTHMHPDHTGLASYLREVSGAPWIVHRLEAEAMRGPSISLVVKFFGKLREWGAPRRERARLYASLWRQRKTGRAAAAVARPDATVDDGAVLDIPGRRLRVIHTPGHTEGSICLYDEDSRVLFTGDTLLPMIHPGIGLGGATDPRRPNPLASYLSSLDRLAALDAGVVHPGHGYTFVGLHDRVEETRGHHVRRSDEVRSIISADPGARIWKVAERVHWTAGWRNLDGFMRLSAVAQTSMHVDYIQATPRA